MILRRTYVLLPLIFVCQHLAAQTFADTVALARSLRDRGDGKAALKILESMAAHTNDFNVFWLYAETAYQQRHFHMSRDLYQYALKLAPNNAYLQLDFARKLLSVRYYRRAEMMLLKLSEYDVTSQAARYELAKLYYWKTNLKLAKSAVQQIINRNPDNQDALQLKKDIVLSAAPWIKFNSFFSDDSQPLRSFTASIEAGKTFGKFLSPFAGIYQSTFYQAGRTIPAQSVVIGNQFTFPGAGLNITGSVGLFRLDNYPSYSTYSISLTKSFLH